MISKILLAGLFCMAFIVTGAQVNIRGTVTDGNENALSGATVFFITGGTERTTITNTQGEFVFNKVKENVSGLIRATFTGMQQAEENVFTNQNKTLRLTLTANNYFLDPLEVKAVRAADKAPFTKTNISKKAIEALNLGQDIPFLLNQTPSVTVNSDAGNGVGYTGIRIRGTDATRINVTLNGIPYNDAESQGTFFVDLPDFASSASSIQIQRGVGTSTNGAGAFGATINISTNEFQENAYAELNNSYGSFNTLKNTVRVGSGLLNDHFTIDARLSSISSDGYVDRATSDLRSFFVFGSFYYK